MDEASAAAGVYVPFGEDDHSPCPEGTMYLSRLSGGGFGETYYAYFSKEHCRAGGVPDGVVKVFTHGNDPDVQEQCRNSEFHRLESARDNARELRDLSPRPCSRGNAYIHPRNYPAFLMSFVEGVSFEDVLCDMARGNTPSARERLAYATALAEPLRALHSAQARAADGTLVDQYMHGDIKPNNLIVQYEPLDGIVIPGEQWSREVFPRGRHLEDGQQKFQIKKCCLLDFGTLREDADVARQELTPPWELDIRQIGLYTVYAAPERLNSDEIELRPGVRVVYPGCLSVSAKSDVWSYGILLLRMCFPDLYDLHYHDTRPSGQALVSNLPSMKAAIEESARATRSRLEDACRSIACLHSASDKRYLAVIDSLFAHVIVRCIEAKPNDRPTMDQIERLFRNTWGCLRNNTIKSFDADSLKCFVESNLGTKHSDRVATPPFVDTSPESTESVAGAWDNEPYDLDPGDTREPSAAQKFDDVIDRHPDDGIDHSAPLRNRFRTAVLSTLACLPSVAIPLVFWCVLSSGGAIHVDAVPIALGFLAVLIGAVAVVLSKGTALVFTLASLALSATICIALPDTAMTFSASLGSSNAQYHIAERLDSEGNTDAAFEHYMSSAEAGNPFANYALGEYYEYGSGPAEQNSETASEYYSRAEELGYSPK